MKLYLGIFLSIFSLSSFAETNHCVIVPDSESTFSVRDSKSIDVLGKNLTIQLAKKLVAQKVSDGFCLNDIQKSVTCSIDHLKGDPAKPLVVFFSFQEEQHPRLAVDDAYGNYSTSRKALTNLKKMIEAELCKPVPQSCKIDLAGDKSFRFKIDMGGNHYSEIMSFDEAKAVATDLKAIGACSEVINPKPNCRLARIQGNPLKDFTVFAGLYGTEMEIIVDDAIGHFSTSSKGLKRLNSLVKDGYCTPLPQDDACVVSNLGSGKFKVNLGGDDYSEILSSEEATKLKGELAKAGLCPIPSDATTSPGSAVESSAQQQ
jgi:hypothetical protein